MKKSQNCMIKAQNNPFYLFYLFIYFCGENGLPFIHNKKNILCIYIISPVHTKTKTNIFLGVNEDKM